jgi:hypothetical protein
MVSETPSTARVAPNDLLMLATVALILDCFCAAA